MVIEETPKMVVKDLTSAVIQQNKPRKPGNNQTQLDAEAIEARESRGQWGHPLDFLFSCISVSVGLGSK